jgi:hypothetical protein
VAYSSYRQFASYLERDVASEAANAMKSAALLPPLAMLSFTQKSEGVMELDGSLAKRAFRANNIPSPRCGGGLGRGGGQAQSEQNDYTKGHILSPSPYPPPARGGGGEAGRSEFSVKLSANEGRASQSITLWGST